MCGGVVVNEKQNSPFEFMDFWLFNGLQSPFREDKVFWPFAVCCPTFANRFD